MRVRFSPRPLLEKLDKFRVPSTTPGTLIYRFDRSAIAGIALLLGLK
ncbi:MAG: hypothetical protein HC789_02430 [Microcoleus sp. CSU_2_2]|nr:hypothetical protein [Microcoleus sp. CSU_2_2]